MNSRSRELPDCLTTHHIPNTSPRKVEVRGPCAVTQREYSVTVYEVDLHDFLTKHLASHVFPYLTTEQREFLISGTSPEGWRLIFKGDQ